MNLLLCLLLCSGIVYTSARRYGNSHNDSKDFDVLIFTQSWPQSVCYAWKEKYENRSCALPADEEWSIHGIWPTRFGTIGPQFCNTSWNFDANALRNLESELKIKWLDVHNGSSPYSFWKHEWDKHGTCASVIPRMNNITKYFQTGLDMLEEYDMKHVLAKALIEPGSSVMVNDVLKGVKKVLGVNSQVECVHNHHTGDSYILEIRICFNKRMELVDCDGIVGFPTNCPRNTKIFYPSHVPHKYEAIQV